MKSELKNKEKLCRKQQQVFEENKKATRRLKEREPKEEKRTLPVALCYNIREDGSKWTAERKKTNSG